MDNNENNNEKEKKLRKIFSSRLLELRLKKGETRLNASKTIGIHNNTLRNYEEGERLPNILEFKKICDHYNVSYQYLLGESDVKCSDLNFIEINKLTGLSEKSINVLSNKVRINGNRLKILNYIIENEIKYQFITVLELFLMCRVEDKSIYNKLIPGDTKQIEKSSLLSSIFKCDIDKILYRMENDLFENKEKK